MFNNLLEKIRKQGGATLINRFAVEITFFEGYQVGSPEGLQLKNISYRDVENFVRNHQDVFFTGIWYDEEEKIWYLEESYFVCSFQEAVVYAFTTDQKSIWDWQNSEEIQITEELFKKTLSEKAKEV